MEYNLTSIILGTGTLYAIAYLLVAGLTFAYSKYAHIDKKSLKLNPFLAYGLFAAGWLVVVFGVVALASSWGTVVFGLASFILVALLSFFFSRSFFAIEGKGQLIYSFLTAAVLNPVWLNVFGLI